MTDLDAITRELATIVEQLNELPRDAFAERHALAVRQDELRAMADAFREDIDDSRSTAELVTELNARRSALDAIYDTVQDYRTTDETAGLSGRMLEAQGAGPLRARIAKIESVLATRPDRPESNDG